MMNFVPYCPQGQYIWDFWIYEENGEYHLYYLQAPLEGNTPRTRHRASSVGHAVSRDLIHWEEKGVVLQVNEDDNAWDSVSIWTGCTVKKDDIYYMFYTARSKKDVLEDGYAGHTQRIGVALSKDLHHWEKYEGNPVLTADYRYYESAREAYNKHEGWRDPFVVYDEEENVYYAFITARDKAGDPKARGCIARAKSSDLLHWEVLPPAASPHTFTDMEVPSLHKYNDKWYMIFAVKEAWYSEEYKQKIYPNVPQTGELYFVCNSLSGEFTPIDDDNVLIGTEDRMYTGRIVKGPDGNDVLLSWYAGEDEGCFDGKYAYTLSKPMRVRYDDKGKLKLEK